MAQAKDKTAVGNGVLANRQALTDQQTHDEHAIAEKRASDHRNQIRSVAQAAVQAMVNAHRNS